MARAQGMFVHSQMRALAHQYHNVPILCAAQATALLLYIPIPNDTGNMCGELFSFDFTRATRFLFVRGSKGVAQRSSITLFLKRNSGLSSER